MKSFATITIFVLISIFANAQFGYKNKLEPVSGIEISYKLAHSKMFDKESPVQMRFKFKNTTEQALQVDFKIEYTTGLTTRYESEPVSICIPQKTARTGKMHGLAFELNTNDTKIFECEGAQWDFVTLEVEQIEECLKESN